MVVLRRKVYEMLRKEDFACRCGCGANDMDEKVLSMFDNAMGLAGFRFEINSGFRCKEHNAIVGGSETSGHLKGLAADIRVIDNWYRYKIVTSLIYVGFERIILYKGKLVLHVDADTDKPKEILCLY